jgi:alpha-glucoside transport system substrate-binding protein
MKCMKLVCRLYAGAAGIAIGAAGGAAAQELMFAPGEGVFSWESYEAFAEAHDFSGQVLTISGAGTGSDAVRQNNVFAYFAAATGAEVSYSGSDSFEQDIVISVQAGSPPDIALFPQPGLATDLAALGVLVPLGEETREWMLNEYAAGESWVEMATYPGPDGEEEFYGIFYGKDVKSLVWYAPEAFEEAGYEIPQTMEALKELTEQIVADGGTPWCIGLGAGAGTGWPATDWVEDMMLRTQPTEVYDQWVTNEMPFDDPRVIEAIEEYGWFVRNDEFVAGGSNAAATIDFRDSPAGLFSFPPECYMHKQASFIPNFFPAGVEMGADVDFFYFPAYESKDLGTPLLGSGGLVTITRDSEVARAFIEFLKLPVAHELFMAQGQWLTAYTAANPEAYANPTQRALGEILTGATTFRFDGSDLMPSEIGTSAFWTAMVDYTTGASAEEVAARVQARWDSIR